MWQPWCCHFLLGRATGANRPRANPPCPPPPTDSLQALHMLHMSLNIQTNRPTHSHSCSINLPACSLSSILAWPPPPQGLEGSACAQVSVQGCVCVSVCLFIYFSISSVLHLPFVSPLLMADTCCNKVNEFGKWQDSRWYFSAQLPSNNTMGVGWKAAGCLRESTPCAFVYYVHWTGVYYLQKHVLCLNSYFYI